MRKRNKTGPWMDRTRDQGEHLSTVRAFTTRTSGFWCFESENPWHICVNVSLIFENQTQSARGPQAIQMSESERETVPRMQSMGQRRSWSPEP